ncbi:hypothetical protein GCM10017771_85270 [Streptomyces capitiformicae]|uniref:Uncharacterized protein n=1 Tax=Streptomyces capitiformicae TaxID=2014920 RepID=A0A919DP84_9ACTN|nr:hypothetical protein GCM10017771_85270 [Streptomyces capitiformicae]
MMATAEQLDLGYLAWSWSGNTDPILDLSIGFDPNQLSSWGRRVHHQLRHGDRPHRRHRVHLRGLRP